MCDGPAGRIPEVPAGRPAVRRLSDETVVPGMLPGAREQKVVLLPDLDFASVDCHQHSRLRIRGDPGGLDELVVVEYQQVAVVRVAVHRLQVEAGVPAVAPRWTREVRIHATAHCLRDDGHRLPLEVLVVAEAAEEIIIQRAVADRQPPWFENHEADWRTAHAAVADEQRAVPLPDLPALPVTAARLAPACPAEPADTPVNQNRSMQW